MKLKGKKKELTISMIFICFILALFAASFYYNYNNAASEGMKLSPTGNVASFIDTATSKLDLIGVTLIVFAIITGMILVKYLRAKTKKRAV